MVFVEPFFEFKSVLGHYETMRYEDAPKKILIVNLGGLGDVLLSTPALRALRKHYPQARIVFCGVPRTCELVRGFPYIDEAVLFDPYEEKTRSFRWGRVGRLLFFLNKLRSQKFDLAINMRTIVSWPSALKTALLFSSIGAHTTVGRDTDGKGFFFNAKVPEHWPGDRHEMDYDLATVALLGVDVSDRSLRWDIPVSSREAVAQLLAQEGVGPHDRLIGFHVGGIATRRWPLSYFAETIREIQKVRPQARVVISAGPSEVFLFEQLKRETQGPLVNMAARLDWNELAALIERCDVFVTGDSGPMHVAAILGKPLVAIFGGGSLERYDPRRISDRVVVLSSGVDCVPCLRLKCRSLKCLRNIMPRDVGEAIFSFNEGSIPKESKGRKGISPVEKVYRWLRDMTSRPEERREFSAGYWQAKIRENAIQMCAGISGRLLEIGCGEGLFLSLAAKRYPHLELVGVDHWPVSLMRAREVFKKFNVARISLVEAEASHLSFADESFDIVVCVNVLINVGSLPQAQEIIAEMSRLCKRGGRLIIEFRNSLNPFLHLKYKLARYYDSTVKDKYLSMYRLRDIEALLSKYRCPVRGKRYLEFPIKALAPIVIVEAEKC
jgi:heptosyltransferase-2/heptosyltransferase-3